jgi:iron complex transport system permease protein
MFIYLQFIMQQKNKTPTFFLPLVGLLVLLFFLSLLVGQIDINSVEVLQILVQLDIESINGKIIFLHRMPKSIVAILTGIALPTSGFLLQELFKNPLAGPSVLGISSTAALGVAIFIFFGVSFLPLSFLDHTWIIIFFAFLGASLASILLVLFSIRIKSPNHLIVIGFILSAFSGALISFMEYLSESDKIKEFIFWGFGSFSAMDWTQIFIYAFCISVLPYLCYPFI